MGHSKEQWEIGRSSSTISKGSGRSKVRTPNSEEDKQSRSSADSLVGQIFEVVSNFRFLLPG